VTPLAAGLNSQQRNPAPVKASQLTSLQ
jgi:hypothetical protein